MDPLSVSVLFQHDHCPQCHYRCLQMPLAQCVVCRAGPDTKYCSLKCDEYV